MKPKQTKSQPSTQVFETYKQLLTEFISFKSISTDSDYKSEMIKTVDWLKNLFLKNDFKVDVIIGKNSNPLLVAKLVVSPELPTTLVYGHYDVQPAAIEDGWSNDPFILTEKKGKLVARGVVDNKGQVLIHIVSVIEAYKNNTLGQNVIFLIEGNEESGNLDLAKQLKEYKKEFACDQIIISDGEVVGENPTLEASLRGGGNIRVEMRTAPSDQHSGINGGAIPNAPVELMKILAGLKDKNNKVAISDFYKGAPKITAAQLKNNKMLGTDKEFMTLSGVKGLVCEKGLDPNTQTGLRPTLEVSGFSSGYTGNGFKNIVPAYAEARVNIRTVAGQDSQQVINSVIAHIKKLAPKYVDLKITSVDPYPAIMLPVDGPYAQFLTKLLEESYGKKLVIHYVGGGLPIVEDFKTILKGSIYLVPFGNDGCNMHGIDENFKIGHIKKALSFANKFWETRFEE